MLTQLNRSTSAVLLVTLALIVATGVALSLISRAQGRLDRLYVREASFAYDRLRSEVQKFEMAVLDAVAQGGWVDPARDHRLRYEVVWNRLDLGLNASVYVAIPGSQRKRALIENLFDLHKAHEALFTGSIVTLRAERDVARRYFHEANRLADMAIKIAAENRRAMIRDQTDRLAQLYWVVTTLVVMAATGFVGFASLLLREMRSRQRQHSQLEHVSNRLINALALAEESNSQKDEFLAHMSHEFRTPLNAILGYADFIKHRYHDGLPKGCVSYIDAIQLGGRQLLGFVEDLFDLSRLQSALGEAQANEFAVLEALEEARLVTTVTADDSMQKPEVRVSVDPPTLSMRADRRSIIRVVVNLTSNAVIHSRSTKPVNVSAALDASNQVVLSVRDQGIGMSPEMVGRVFEPFWQGEAGAAVSRSGGLGMHICARIVELHGGRIEVDSAVGEGTTVRVILPRAPSFAGTDRLAG